MTELVVLTVLNAFCAVGNGCIARRYLRDGNWFRAVVGAAIAGLNVGGTFVGFTQLVTALSR